MLENPSQPGSPEFRRLVLDLLRAERGELERLSARNDLSPTVAERAVRHLRTKEADASPLPPTR